MPRRLLPLLFGLAACSHDVGAFAVSTDATTQDVKTSDVASFPPETNPAEAAVDASSCVGDLGACEACCGVRSPSGAIAFENLVRGCACDGKSCGSQCAATLCASKPSSADPGCRSCIEVESRPGGACRAELTAKCNDSGGCATYRKCLLACTG